MCTVYCTDVDMLHFMYYLSNYNSGKQRSCCAKSVISARYQSQKYGHSNGEKHPCAYQVTASLLERIQQLIVDTLQVRALTLESTWFSADVRILE